MIGRSSQQRFCEELRERAGSPVRVEVRYGMQVAFYKVDEGRLCGWAAASLKRKRFQGTTMASGRDLPHDLAQFVVEEALGLECGFWGLL